MLIAPSPCHLLTLPYEIIVEILSYCSTEAIINLECTCKSLLQVCRSRPVWKTLMQGLDIATAPTLLPFQTAESFSDSDLRKKVISSIRLQQTWNNPGEVPSLRTLELPLHHIDDNRIIKARLLPGGKELIIANHGTVELWSIESRQCLWCIPAPADHIDSVGFDFDLAESGRVLLVAIVCDDNNLQPMSLLRLYAYDFLNRAGELVFERQMPLASPSRIMLHGDFFISCIPRSFQTVVINWRTGHALIVDFVDATGVRIDARAKLLADNNLIAFVNRAESGFYAIMLPLSALRGCWSDAPDHNAWRHILFSPSEQGYSVVPLPYERSTAQNGSTGFGPWVLAHRVFRPPWRTNGPTEIFVVSYTCCPGGEAPMRLVSFHLQLSHSGGSTSVDDSGSLTLVNSGFAFISRLPRNPRNISNAGLMFSLRHQLQCFSLFSEREQPISSVQLGDDVAPYSEEIEPNISSVDPWTGAMAVRMPGIMKVLYFD